MDLLEVQGLSVEFASSAGPLRAVDGVSFSVAAGETFGIVGESGSGKSVTCLSLLGLLGPAKVSGSVVFKGQDLLHVGPAALRKARGGAIGMVFQDPLSSLNPYHRAGRQVVEAITTHQAISKRAARARAIDLLGLVGIRRPAERFDSWPHELSGGMRQRVMIAMALANDPDLLIGDEPTTALDVSVQAQIVELIARLKDELGIAVILVTHNMGVVAEIADRVMVMYAGQGVETATCEDIFHRPSHPYTWGLLASIPGAAGPRSRGEKLPSIGGLPPTLAALPPGCRFHPRCLFAMDICRTVGPVLEDVGGPGHQAACHLPESRRPEARAALASQPGGS
jgi:peptide/nickel transport system ATP-binding protein